MKILIAYATTDGQTRKVARHAADRLADAGHTVELLPAADALDVDLGRFDGAILAGSVHLGGYQKPLTELVGKRAADLARLPTLFLSVSLSAAGHEPEDWQGLERVVERFKAATGWEPGQVEHVAGAFSFSQYDIFRAWAMRRIAAQRGEQVAEGEDREYTDWPALERAVSAWAASLLPAG